MPRPGIVCAGNWIVDRIHTIAAWPRESDLAEITGTVSGVGGGAANVALNLSALQAGIPVVPVGLTGDDDAGRLIRTTLAEAGLSARHLAEAAAPTAETHVMTLPGRSRTFFYRAGTNALFGLPHVPIADLRDCGWFYLGYVNLLPRLDRVARGTSEGAAVLAAARAAGMVTVVDLVSSLGDGFGAAVAAVLPLTDVLFLNEVEAARATGAPDLHPGDVPALAAAAARLRAGGAGTVVLHTAAGALWLAPDGPLWRPAPAVDPATVVSPVGAGDAFCAGVLAALHAGRPPAAALDLGHRLGGLALASPTATGGTPRLADLQ